MPKVRSELITLKEAADILKISLGYAYHCWPSWINWGVRAIRTNGKGRPKFSKDEIYEMLNKWRVA